MDELLQKLVESELLTEDTKSQLEEALSNKFEEKTKAIREEVETEVKADLAEKYAKDKEELVEALDTALTKAVTAEVEELKEDIERFRDLEAEYAQKLVEARQTMAEAVKQDMSKLLEGLDAYVDQRLHVELDELKESIEDVRKENYGRRIVETLGEEYRKMFTNEDDLEQRISEKEQEFNEVTKQLKEAQEKLRGAEREQKMDEILESLSGHKREVMAAILEGVPTDKLEEGYRRYIGRVLKEDNSAGKDSEKDNTVLAEEQNADSEETLEEDEGLRVASGDRQVPLDESEEEAQPNAQKLDENYIRRLKQLSGINS